MSQYDAIKAANAAFVASIGEREQPPMPPSRKAAVVVCMCAKAMRGARVARRGALSDLARRGRGVARV